MGATSPLNTVLPLIQDGFLHLEDSLTCSLPGVTAEVTADGLRVGGNTFQDPTDAMAAVCGATPPDGAGWQFWKLPNPERHFIQPLEHVRASYLNRTEAQSIRTSESHPLRINSLRIPSLPGELGLTFCPGKKGDAIYGGRWERDLRKDLEVVRKWGPAAVVSLLEEHEFDLLGVPEFPAVMGTQEFQWLLLRIPDSDIPREDFEQAWPSVKVRLLEILKGGGKVLIHCRGGLGRTGVVAALILVEAGIDPALAVELVREARPGAIETWEQYQYVLESK